MNSAKRALRVAGLHQLAAFADVGRGRRHTHARKRNLEARILGILAGSFLEVVECRVVVFARLGGLTLLEIGVGRFAESPGARQAKARGGGEQRDGEDGSRCHDSGHGRSGRAIHPTPRRFSRPARAIPGSFFEPGFEVSGGRPDEIAGAGHRRKTLFHSNKAVLLPVVICADAGEVFQKFLD